LHSHTSDIAQAAGLSIVYGPSPYASSQGAQVALQACCLLQGTLGASGLFDFVSRSVDGGFEESLAVGLLIHLEPFYFLLQLLHGLLLHNYSLFAAQ